jgi:hypothetical protein
MKKILLLPIFILLLGCSKDEDIAGNQEEFFMAQVDGEEYFVGGSNSIIRCKKHLTDLGTIGLAVKASTGEGKDIEIIILNYNGANTYLFANNTYIPINGNWMKYSQALPQGVWSTTQNTITSNRAILEITNDDGKTISGTFSFDAQDEFRESIRSISEGNFSVEID